MLRVLDHHLTSKSVQHYVRLIFLRFWPAFKTGPEVVHAICSIYKEQASSVLINDLVDIDRAF